MKPIRELNTPADADVDLMAQLQRCRQLVQIGPAVRGGSLSNRCVEANGQTRFGVLLLRLNRGGESAGLNRYCRRSWTSHSQFFMRKPVAIGVFLELQIERNPDVPG